MTTIAGVAFLLAFLVSYAVTPLIRAIAKRIGFVDRPDGRRKIQTDAVALGGGISLLLATPLATCVLFWLIGWDDILHGPYQGGWLLIGLAVAAAVLGIAGIVDDGFGIRGSNKLLWQVVAALVIAGSGTQMTIMMSISGGELQLGFLGIVVTVVWLLASINSFNLIDGVDGLAGSVGVVFSLAIGAISVYRGEVVNAIIVFSLAGALLGFLRLNYSPATIYLGDTGSMFIGLLLGTITLRSSTKQAATLAFAVPLAIWAIPIFDSLAAIVRRKLTGRSIYTTDRGHLHHVLLTRGLKTGQAVALITLLCAVTSAAAIASVILNKFWIGLMAVGSIITFLVFTRVFGHVEFLLLNSRLLGLGRHLQSSDSDSAKQSKITLQGSRQWEEFWGSIVSQSDRYRLTEMTLNLSLPRLHEDFYATWKSGQKPRRDTQWNVEIPLLIDGDTVGRLRVSGTNNEGDIDSNLSLFVRFVETLQAELRITVRKYLDDINNTEGNGASPPSEHDDSTLRRDASAAVEQLHSAD